MYMHKEVAKKSIRTLEIKVASFGIEKSPLSHILIHISTLLQGA